MRFSPAAIALSLTLAMISSASLSKRPDHVIHPQSLALMQSGDEAAKAGDLPNAISWYETALAVDPRNRPAYALLAEVAVRQGLPGKAIRLYRESLTIEPNDVAALAGQGEAMVAKGAVTKARENLARIKSLCIGACPEGARLTAIIAKGPPATVQSAQATVAAKN